MDDSWKILQLAIFSQSRTSYWGDNLQDSSNSMEGEIEATGSTEKKRHDNLYWPLFKFHHFSRHNDSWRYFIFISFKYPQQWTHPHSWTTLHNCDELFPLVSPFFYFSAQSFSSRENAGKRGKTFPHFNHFNDLNLFWLRIGGKQEAICVDLKSSILYWRWLFCWVEFKNIFSAFNLNSMAIGKA